MQSKKNLKFRKNQSPTALGDGLTFLCLNKAIQQQPINKCFTVRLVSTEGHFTLHQKVIQYLRIATDHILTNFVFLLRRYLKMSYLIVNYKKCLNLREPCSRCCW